MTRANWTEILEIVIRRAKDDIRVALPARILRSKTPDRVDLRLAVTIPRGDNSETLPDLLDIPVQLPQSAAGGLLLSLSAGDTGLAIFSDHHLGNWLDGVNDIAPSIDDPHGLSGCVFVPGLWPNGQGPQAPAGAATLEARGGEALEVLSGEVRAGRGAVELATLGTTHDAALRVLVSAISAFASAIAALPGHSEAAGALATACSAYLAGSYLGTVTRVK